MWRLAQAKVGAKPETDDLWQDIWLAVWRAIPNFRHDASERTWIYRIAHNVAISARTKSDRKRKRETHDETLEVHTPAASHQELDLLRQERRRQLLDGIGSLPLTDRQIILLHLEGLSYADIEAVTGLSRGAIATRLTRIRQKLTARVRAMEVRP